MRKKLITHHFPHSKKFTVCHVTVLLHFHSVSRKYCTTLSGQVQARGAGTISNGEDRWVMSSEGGVRSRAWELEGRNNQ